MKKFSFESCRVVLDRQAPGKKKYIRGNPSLFMGEERLKTIMTRTRRRNKFLKNKTLSNKQDYNKEGDYCLKLLRKTKREYYNILNEKNVIDNNENDEN